MQLLFTIARRLYYHFGPRMNRSEHSLRIPLPSFSLAWSSRWYSPQNMACGTRIGCSALRLQRRPSNRAC